MKIKYLMHTIIITCGSKVKFNLVSSDAYKGYPTVLTVDESVWVFATNYSTHWSKFKQKKL